MNRHATNITAVFLKDLRQLWPLAALSATIILAQTSFVHSNWLHNAAFVIPGIFIVSLVQQDSPASLRHEWLTRPVGSLEALLAKILFAAIAILLPAILGPIVSAAIHGTSVSDALLLAIVGIRFNLLVAFVLLLVAAVTSTMAEAAGLLAGLILFLLAAQFPGNTGVRVGGSSWTILDVIVVITLVGGTVVLWFQYAQRRTIAARCALGAMISILVLAMALLVGIAGNTHSQAISAPPPQLAYRK